MDLKHQRAISLPIENGMLVLAVGFHTEQRTTQMAIDEVLDFGRNACHCLAPFVLSCN
jgi:hypothetical protein